MKKRLLDFIQTNSPDGGFLQSEYWWQFQKAWGRETHTILVNDNNGEPIVFANIITHKLPLVGDYFYVPRGPIINQKYNVKIKSFFGDLIDLANRKNIGWIRIEPADREVLNLITENLSEGLKIKKSPVDMQPREILMLDISKSEEEILAQMKQKTRYNIRLAEKRGVRVTCNTKHIAQENIENFSRLVKITTKRDKITPHPENYYRKMFETIPPEILKLYIAEFDGKIIAANLVLFFGKTATYMHGASDDVHRDVMAPYLLQWQSILDAKKAGCAKYDFGGVKRGNAGGKSWGGITKFKTGFALDVEPVQFTGCYDIILKPTKYNLYRALQKIKRFI